mmetsp:Transcript_23593/g.69028  ORF Transcript_23593/g.69028 Transcript_23593/m.69028 type:complete len:651 (-) Transcript_23593:125-2077(-)|eukprot:CAMPEP_0118977884 /NCGR_PEP_ID=MMETSP1173-20130426/22376_1 /TAXON_ID=1034831 /ORGANISM="Rhizochromulina marina cf, Strain CCMP1243" /LENGTH=650 /DNA_ID=CAMNT_0006928033 /DNA_START=68 /DNA_END=2020 /DNA_ORIENTATION=+
MDDHFQRVLGTSGAPEAGSAFIAAKDFAGARSGYVFTTRQGRTGYYRDGSGRKRGRGSEEEEGEGERHAKLARGGGRAGGGQKPLDAAAMLEQLEQERGITAEMDFELDLASLKTMLVSFEKKINRNQQLRVKYVDDPAKFLESEVALDSEIKQLFAVAAAPELFPDFVKLGAVTSLLGLLSHENTDISIGVIALLNELTDPETAEEAEEAVDTLVSALVEDQGLELLVQNLSRLDESTGDDAEGIQNTLAIIENLSDIRPSICADLCEKTGILKFLLMRLKVRKFDGNKLYASEILSILVQADTKNAQRLGDLSGTDGVDLLLQALSYYRKREPAGEEEQECVENMFNSLGAALLLSENQTKFRRSEGFELMLRCMREKNYAGTCAVKVIDFATANNPTNSERFVETGGLKVLFPAFMGNGVARPKKHRKRATDERRLAEAQVVSVLSTLAVQLSPESRRDCFPRFIAKFLEGDLEKVDRLVELFVEYDKAVKEYDRNPNAGEEDEEDDLDGIDPEIRLLAGRLSAGLDVLRQVSVVMATVAIHSPRARSRIQEKLHEKNRRPSEVKAILVGHAKDLLDKEGSDPADHSEEAHASSARPNEEKTKSMVASLAISFPTEVSEGEAAAAEEASAGAATEEASAGAAAAATD